VQYQRGLAGAVGAEERYALTSVDVQTHAEKGLVAVRVRVGQTANIEDRRGHVGGIRPV
jgi:hypothetical protein